MNWTKLAEDRIEEAMANGEFDHLPGRGQPLDLAEYFSLPAAERAGAMVLKNANVLPPEVQLLREIEELESAITAESVSLRPSSETNETNSRRPLSPPSTQKSNSRNRLVELRARLQEKRVALALAMERRRRRDPRAID